MNSPSKATSILTVSENIDHVQNVPDPVSVYVSCSMDMHWYGVCINQLVFLRKIHKSTFSATGDNMETLS